MIKPLFYNLLNNFCGLSLDKTDHVMQNLMMVISQYLLFDLISVVWFYFDASKFSSQTSVKETKKDFLQKPVTDK